jgi:hypothetical protein
MPHSSLATGEPMLNPQDFRGPCAFDAAGRFFSYIEHTSPATVPGIRLWVEGQPVGVILPGQTFEVDQDCRRWELVPIDPACTGRVLIGYGRMHTGRVVGPVETESAATLAVEGAAHHLCQWGVGGAGLFRCQGLYAAGRTLIVRRIMAAAAGYNMYRGTGVPTAPLSGRVPTNKHPNGPAATAVGYQFDAATLAGPITGVALGASVHTGTTNPSELVTSAPWIIPPDGSLWLIHTTAAAVLMATFEFEEA